MAFARLRALLVGALFGMALSSCGGGGASPPRPASPAQPGGLDPAATAPTIGVPLAGASGTYDLPLSQGYSGTISLHSTSAPAGTDLKLRVVQPAVDAASADMQAQSKHGRTCPGFPKITLINPFPFPVSLDIDGFKLKLPCDLSGTLFGVSFFQERPIPATVISTKLGDFTASGRTIVFKPTVTELTLPPFTESAISILAEQSTAEIGLPAAPGSTTVLTSNAPTLPSSLSFTYTTSSGGSEYSAACFPAFVNGQLVAALKNVPIVGIPAFYCALNPANAPTITFGNTVKFSVGAPKPDRAFLELDGPTNAFPCTDTATPECDTPAFTVPTIQNVIVGNVQDLRACVFVNPNADCNNVKDAVSPPPAATSVLPNHAVDVLVADDPTYAAPAFGGFELTIPSGSACRINNGPDENGDVPGPPFYTDPGGPQASPPATGGTATDAKFVAVGPYAEFDLVSGSSGTCSVTVTETDGPLKRSVTLSLPIAATE